MRCLPRLSTRYPREKNGAGGWGQVSLSRGLWPDHIKHTDLCLYIMYYLFLQVFFTSHALYREYCIFCKLSLEPVSYFFWRVFSGTGPYLRPPGTGPYLRPRDVALGHISKQFQRIHWCALLMSVIEVLCVYHAEWYQYHFQESLPANEDLMQLMSNTQIHTAEDDIEGYSLVNRCSTRMRPMTLCGPAKDPLPSSLQKLPTVTIASQGSRSTSGLQGSLCELHC